MTGPHATPLAEWDEHKLIPLRADMATLRYDHRRLRLKAAIFFVAFLPLVALLLAAEVMAGLYLFTVLTAVVVLAGCVL